jgi:predicted kinase
VLDCIEFDDRLRLGDALADVAFLAMDLERLGRPDLAERFLRAYREHADDTWPASLAHHHVAYRAQVRAKVGAVRAGQADPAAAPEARELLGLARRHLRAGAIRLVLIGGLPGTGKSTLAAGLADALGATVLRSDEVRKELAGLRPDQPAPAEFGEGLYRPAATAATYREILRRTVVALALGEIVVLDASWTAERWRADAREVAARTDAELAGLRCCAPPDLVARRIRRRVAMAAIVDTSSGARRSPRSWRSSDVPAVEGPRGTASRRGECRPAEESRTIGPGGVRASNGAMWP